MIVNSKKGCLIYCGSIAALAILFAVIPIDESIKSLLLFLLLIIQTHYPITSWLRYRQRNKNMKPDEGNGE